MLLFRPNCFRPYLAEDRIKPGWPDALPDLLPEFGQLGRDSRLQGLVSLVCSLAEPGKAGVDPDPETLAAIAETTGGRFFEAPTSQDLAQIYQSLGSRVGSTYEEQEVTQYFAAAGLVFVVVGVGLAALWFNRFP